MLFVLCTFLKYGYIRHLKIPVKIRASKYFSCTLMDTSFKVKTRRFDTYNFVWLSLSITKSQIEKFCDNCQKSSLTTRTASIRYSFSPNRRSEKVDTKTSSTNQFTNYVRKTTSLQFQDPTTLKNAPVRMYVAINCNGHTPASAKFPSPIG